MWCHLLTRGRAKASEVTDSETVLERFPQGIVYRDVKLENTLLDGSDPPIVQLCDFGVS